MESMLRMQARVCLGNDGFNNSMWQEWQAAYFLHKAASRDPRRMSGSDIVQMAIYNNAALAGNFFPSAPIGQIIPGAFADLIFVDYQSPTPLHCRQPALAYHLWVSARHGHHHHRCRKGLDERTRTGRPRRS